MENWITSEFIKTDDIDEKIPKETTYIEEISPQKQASNKGNFTNKFVDYFKRNWIFLSTIFIIWLVTGIAGYYSYRVKSPDLAASLWRFDNGGPAKLLRYFTATYNGPVGKFTIYSFLGGFVAKTTYLLAMTEVVFPAIKRLFRKKGQKNKSSASSLVKSFTDGIKSPKSIGFLVCGLGIAFFISNFLTRNGKSDKSFILILAAFVLFTGLTRYINSGVNFAADKIFGFITLSMPRGAENADLSSTLLKFGAILGFILAIFIGGFGQYFLYAIGFVAIVCGIVLSYVFKEKSSW